MSYTRNLVMSMAFVIVAVLILPSYASAVTDSQDLVTEVVSVAPASDDNDEVVNIANETIPYNIDTWNPRPAGIFVGGTIEESLIRLTEVGMDGIYPGNDLEIATIIQLRQDIISSGASEFIVRLPMWIDADPARYPYQVDLWIYELSGAQLSQWHLTGGVGLASHTMSVSHVGEVRAFVDDVARFHGFDADPARYPIYDSMAYNSWLSENRLYARVIAPIVSGEYYLLVCHAHVRVAVPFDIYWNPSDLCSDNITMSRVGYAWNTDPVTSYFRDIPVNADAGWSFVFQVGLGDKSRDWSNYYYAYTMLHFQKYVQVDQLWGGLACGAFTFFMEFRTNSSFAFKYNLTVLAWDAYGGGSRYLLSKSYWHDIDSHDIVIAGNPVNNSVIPYNYGGKYFVRLEIWLSILIADRVQIMLSYDESSPDDSAQNYIEVLRPWSGGSWWQGDLEREIWFAPWCSASLSNSTWNRTDMIVPANHQGFWTGVGHWWDKHWVDILGGIMIVGGAILVCTGIGAGWGIALIVGGIALICYNNIEAFRNAVNSIFQGILDALVGLGNWLYKLGMMIWKALTWLVDKIIYYGAILIGMLMIAVALAIFITPLYMEIKILGAIHYMVLGDMERASASMGGALAPVKQGASLIGKV